MRDAIGHWFPAFGALMVAMASPAFAAPGAAVGKAGAFVQEMISRGTADVSAWPDNKFASPIQQVSYSAQQP